ncbi:MAG TPA: hypothetical protein VN778_01985 [Verrucomicrobiae bacterium]|nr:hypothetical protein [Verrucomicrobiae bacterium]
MFRTSSESNGAEQPVIVGSWTTPGLPVASFAIRSLSNYVVEEGTGKYVRVLPGFDPQAASRVYRRGLEVTTTTYVEGDAGQDPYGGRQGVVVTDQSITDLYNNPGRDIARHIGDFAAKVALWAMHDEAAETRWIVERILAQALGELIDPQTP